MDAPQTREYVTLAGATYRLPRPNLFVRQLLIDFAAGLEPLRQRALAGEIAAAGQICESMLDLLERWLSPSHPGLTRERLAEEWDIDDLPYLMAIVKDFSPSIPSNRASRRATTSRRKVN